MHQELLRIARELVTREGGYPRWVARNRAVSTAYYALFHALAELCARQLVGAWKPWPPFLHIYRSLDHGNARQVFGHLRKAGGVSDALLALGDSFSQLQQERHKADDDIGYRVSRAEADNWIDRAAQAIASIDLMSGDERKFLAARLIGRTRS